MASTSPPAHIQVQHATVQGALDKKNDVLYVSRGQPTSNVVYFQGDVQDLDHVMRSAGSNWGEFSLNNTATFLAHRFPSSNIWIIRAPRMNQGDQCEYDTFLLPGAGLLHFNTVLYSAYALIADNPATQSLPIILLGFSKGGIVLNQFVAEIGTIMECKKSPLQYVLDWDYEDSETKLPNWEPSLRIQRAKASTEFLMQHADRLLSFWATIQSIHWVDSHRFPTNPTVIQHSATFSRTTLAPGGSDRTKFYVHATPRQIGDKNRRWIATQHKRFIQLLKESGNEPVVRNYFENEPKSMMNHFKVLKVFDHS